MNKNKEHIEKLERLIYKGSFEAFNDLVLTTNKEITIQISEIESIFKNYDYEEAINLIYKKAADYKTIIRGAVYLNTEAEGPSSGEYIKGYESWDSLIDFIKDELLFLNDMKRLNVLYENYNVWLTPLSEKDDDDIAEILKLCEKHFAIPCHFGNDECFAPDIEYFTGELTDAEFLEIRKLSKPVYDYVKSYWHN